MCVVLKNIVELNKQDCPSAIALPAVDLFVICVRDKWGLRREKITVSGERS